MKYLSGYRRGDTEKVAREGFRDPRRRVCDCWSEPGMDLNTDNQDLDLSFFESQCL